MTWVLWGVVGFALLVIVLALAGLLAMALGLAPEGSRLRRWSRFFVDHVDAAVVALIGGSFMLMSRRKRKAGPLRAQVRAHAKARAQVREVIADTAAEIRRTNAATEGEVVRIRVAADNRVEAIRAEVASMDDEALLDAARDVGR